MNYEIAWDRLIDFKESREEYEPKLKIPYSLDTAYLKRDFDLDLVVWRLRDENLEQTKKVVDYVLTNFNKLFETAWTAFYYWYIHNIDCTLAEFFQLIYFDWKYAIRVELNSDYLMDGTALYHFVVATDDDLSDDNVRLYMQDNQCCASDTNNESMVILHSADFADVCVAEMAEAVKSGFAEVYEKMEQEQISLAPSFCG